MKRRNCIVAFVLAIAITGSLVWAGTSFRMTCKNERCKFSSTVDFGGDIAFEKMTGYCRKCNTFVYLRWARQGKEDLAGRLEGGKVPKSKPTPIGMIWDASTGRTNDLYACPTCTNAFLPILSENDLRFCPKCGQGSLNMETGEHYD
jgi:Zn finger protein HypA/HybF involved in hydrogenase expression